jgi:hypothetical protein
MLKFAQWDLKLGSKTILTQKARKGAKARPGVSFHKRRFTVLLNLSRLD